ncbi:MULTISPECIES: hypothetical protein [Acinetobacter]|uniref:Uncharacterized protein n=1 Tax=Acinetobacter higginsii TaxID=70347 RepID=N8XR30_9GAMM|nr:MULTISPECIES: hypothetical protein [Acinetobacter]ENV09510.1 hypothetical protein F966_02168 [Acinetobacter higginsii]MCI3877737.1 hypothetical protein [Acinetobacter higginsii]MCJ0828800.1 hypothetical protein [Acinetobacter sp. NIPH1876]
MSLSNSQKIEFRQAMCEKLIDAGLTSGCEIRQSVEILEQFIFLQEKEQIEVACMESEKEALAKHIKSFWDN